MEKIPIRRLALHEAANETEEVYTCDRQGMVKVTLINHATGTPEILSTPAWFLN